MISFLRRSRRKLTNNNNNYFVYILYIIGEIILVVIGILIALQINNANQNRLNKKKIRTYLASIVEDLEIDTTSLNQAIHHFEKTLDNKKWGLQLTDYQKIPIDSLELIFEPNFSIYAITDQAFDKYKNSGITNLLVYDALFDKINIYYTKQMNYYHEIIEFDRNYTNMEGHYWYYEQDIYELNVNNFYLDVQSKEDARRNLITLLKSPRGRNHLKVEFKRKTRVIRDMKLTKKRAIKLIELINITLNKHPSDD